MSKKSRKEWKVFKRVTSDQLNQLAEDGWQWDGRGCHIQFTPDGELNLVAYRVVNSEAEKPVAQVNYPTTPPMVVTVGEGDMRVGLYSRRTGDNVPVALLKEITKRNEQRMTEFSTLIRQTAYDTANAVYAELTANNPPTSWDDMVAREKVVA